MNIFYIGQLDSGGTCIDRMQALERMGHTVTGLNVSNFQSPVRLLSSLQHRFFLRPLLESLNREVCQVLSDQNQFDCAWVDKGVWIFPETAALLKKKCGRLIHFTPDAQFVANKSKLFCEALPLYDHVVTTKSFEVELYKQYGARHTILSQQSYCPVRYAHPVAIHSFCSDIGFVGHYEKHYGNVISRVAAEIKDVSVWGGQWNKAAWRGAVPRRIVKGDGLWQADYVNGLASFKIGLGLLQKNIPEKHTTRSFEIPAAGCFLLAERTDEHKLFFEEGKEAEFFDSPEELISKAKYYLANETARIKIANSGRERCIRSGYDIDSVLIRALAEMDIK